MIKKYLQKIFKIVSYRLFKKIYGSIERSIKSEDDHRIEVKKIKENEHNYKVYFICNGRLYTDRIHDVAAILDNKVIEGPSFQFRDGPKGSIYNSKVDDNIVFEKGTPRKLRILNGSVLSLLTGGAGNNNYWHWLYDVLPRLSLCKKVLKLSEIDYFLLPSKAKSFQKESLDVIGILEKKRISSEKYRHIKAKKLIVTDHPVVTSGNATKDIKNIPDWILVWLKESFLKNNLMNNNSVKNKIYIDRTDENYTKKASRIISNEDEVKKILKNNGYYMAKLHEMNFIDQIKLFNNAKSIIGLHGAGFANISFCKPGTKIIELKSLTAGSVIENLANKNDLNYMSIASEAKEIYEYQFPNQQGSVNISINALRKKIEN